MKCPGRAIFFSTHPIIRNVKVTLSVKEIAPPSQLPSHSKKKEIRETNGWKMITGLLNIFCKKPNLLTRETVFDLGQ